MKTHISTPDLFTLLKAWDDAYYNHLPEVPDSVYDAARDEARRRDPSNPYFATVGARAPVVSAWKKVRHTAPMGSLEKVQTASEMEAWFDDCRLKLGGAALTIAIADKLDGGSVGLYYKDGLLLRAVTRGNGMEGEDITQNVRKMKGVPRSLKSKFTGHVRGEIIVTRTDFKRHFNGYSNPRNAFGAAKDFTGAMCPHFTVIAYEMLPDGERLESKSAEFEALEAGGFVRPMTFITDKGPAEIERIYQKYVLTARAALDYDIDGLVLYVDDCDRRESLGEHGGRPKGATAFKFPSDSGPATLRKDQWQVGASGRVTPVAFFSAVTLAGASVKQATLHNIANIKRIARAAGRDWLAVGDVILVARRGDVIPQVESLITPVEKTPAAAGLPSSSIKLLHKPLTCPSCEELLKMESEYLVCPNKRACPAQTVGAVCRWLDKLNILEWGDSVVEALAAAGKVTSVPDLYRLSEADISGLYRSGVRVGDSTAKKCLDNLRAKMDIPIDLLVGSLGVPMWGRTMVRTLTKAGYDTLGKMTTATTQDLAAISTVGQTKAEAFVQGFREVFPTIYQLLEVGIAIAPPADGPLKGETVCFTGFRDGALQTAIEEAGGTYKDGYSKSVTILVADDPGAASTKLTAARKNGTKVISRDEMWKMVK